MGLKIQIPFPSLEQYVHVFITHGYSICRIKIVLNFLEIINIMKIELLKLFSFRTKSWKCEALLRVQNCIKILEYIKSVATLSFADKHWKLISKIKKYHSKRSNWYHKSIISGAILRLQIQTLIENKNWSNLKNNWRTIYCKLKISRLTLSNKNHICEETLPSSAHQKFESQLGFKNSNILLHKNVVSTVQTYQS